MRIPLVTNFLSVIREESVAARAHFASRPVPVRPLPSAPANVPARRGALEASIRRNYSQFGNGTLPTRSTYQHATAFAIAFGNPPGPSMRYRPADAAPSRREVAGKPVRPSFLLQMTTAQRLSWSINNFHKNQWLKEESQIQEAIAASLLDMRTAGRIRPHVPVTLNASGLGRIQEGPSFHQQFKAAQAALESGHPTGNMCGALALAHMTGTAPQWPQLHEMAMDDFLKNVPAGQASDAQLKAARNIVYEGVYIEHLQALLKKQNIGCEALSVFDANDIDQIFTSGTCKGVTYGYVRPGGTAHFAALRKDAAGQWWDMDSYHDKPQKIASPSAFLKRKCEGELRAERGFDLIHTDI